MNPYRFFSIVFSYPTEETMKEIRAASGTGAAAAFRCGEVLNGVTLEEAQAEYTRLFISAYPQLLCPPYESFYREGLLYGKSSAEVAEIYEGHGLSFAHEGSPPDLLSAELDFMAIAKSEDFLKRVKEWVFEFTGRVRKNSKLYGACAYELENLLKEDRKS